MGGDAIPTVSSGRSATIGTLLPTASSSRAAIKSITYADGALWAALGEDGTVVTDRPDDGRDARPTTSATPSRVSTCARASSPPACRQSVEDVTARLSGDVVWVGRKERVALRQRRADRPRVHLPTWDAPQLHVPLRDLREASQLPGRGGRGRAEARARGRRGLPEVSDGGRTYTFRIRKGFRFSPPSDEEVTAESFRHALERGDLTEDGPVRDDFARR